MKKFFFLLLFVCCLMFQAMADSPYIGSFARMGFGARGMGMGNALVAVATGDINTYYNPALAPFTEKRTASASFGILSLDRSLNFLSYTQPIEPRGGFSIGLINAGVSNIDGRDNDGVHTEDYSTFENQFYLAFANRVSDNLSLGVTVKMYYSKLFEEVSSSTVGFDIGAVFQFSPELTLGASVSDINSKYNWNTTPVYGSLNGKNSKDKFPMVRKFGAAYHWKEAGAIISLEYENTSASTNAFRAGIEYAVHENISVRGGFDRYDFGDDATGAKPSFGFSARRAFGDWTPALTYAFVFEPFSSHDIHVITLSTTF
ncbi:MAG: PorV/PorQ family protein [Ignavibacteriae bacterium]|nr:PorV/PorQ family protein [Ignavibacteriota bacterium]